MGDAGTEERHREVLEVEPVVRRVICARVSDPSVAEDLVQETMARLLEARSDLSQGALVGYAVTAARNSVVSFQRRRETRRRSEPALADPTVPADPEAAVVAEEEQQAVRVALEGLDVEERRWLLAHEVDEVPTADLAEEAGSTPGALAARMARSRAKLRVDYLLALRRARLPSPQCPPVLLALSAGDRRRQDALGAGGHLVQCSNCAAMSEPLMTRRRGLAALLPFALLGQLLRAARRQAAEHPAQATAAPWRPVPSWWPCWWRYPRSRRRPLVPAQPASRRQGRAPVRRPRPGPFGGHGGSGSGFSSSRPSRPTRVSGPVVGTTGCGCSSRDEASPRCRSGRANGWRWRRW